MGFSKNIRRFLSAVYPELSLKELADKLKMDYTGLTRHIKGDVTPSLDKMPIFYQLGVTTDWLITGEGSIFNQTPEGKEAQEKFLCAISIGNEIPTGTKMTNEMIIQEIIDRFGSIDNFYDYLDKYKVKYDREACQRFFNGDEFLSIELEEVFDQIYFYYFMQNKNNKNYESVLFVFNNMLTYNYTGIFTQHKTIGLLKDIRTMINGYFED